ncbi:DUF998 domain-containing protein [Microbispora cellulosiformans]|uniref:DUF998 domain-containing protein n=1 Tax=Microbispora cellulosiformans TaxID=2614688 RepID=A0A5J5JVC8_9ACTN|nr:DUF998 domain-containing protein [Microbispora cellulosiformans]
MTARSLSVYVDAMIDRLLLTCGLVAGPLFTAAYLTEGALRPHYRSLRHPVSSLAIGDRGWIQTVNFLVGGLLSLAFAVGLWRAGPSHWGASLVGGWAIGLLCAGIFRTDPVSGYPPGTPRPAPAQLPAGASPRSLLPGRVRGAGRGLRRVRLVGHARVGDLPTCGPVLRRSRRG